MSYDVRGGGYYYFPKTGWSKSVKQLWNATQKGATVYYDVLDVLYQVSKLIPREDTIAFLQGDFDEPISIPVIKTGIVKCPNAAKDYYEENEFKAGKFFTLSKNESLADWAEKIRFGETYVRGGFGSSGGYYKTDYPPGYNRESLREAVRFAFSKADIPKVSKRKTKSQPKKLSVTDTMVVESLPVRFSNIMDQFLVEDKKENGYIDIPRALNSSLMRVNRAVFHTFGYGQHQVVYNSKKTKWRISEKGEDIIASKSFDLYADGWYLDSAEYTEKLKEEFYNANKYYGFAGKISSQVRKTFYNDGEGTHYGAPQFYIEDISFKIKKMSQVDAPKNTNDLSFFKGRPTPLSLIKFDLIIKFKFSKPKEYKRIEDYFEGNRLEPNYWRRLMFDKSFGTLVPAMVQPTKPKVKKMPKDKWNYYSETGVGRSSVSMDVDIPSRYIQVKFYGNSSDQYAFDSPGTAELLKILKETKWTKGTGGELDASGEDGESWSFARYAPKKK